MKQLYVVNVYSIERNGELIHTITDAVEVLTVHSEITDKVYTTIETKHGRLFKYCEPEYTVEILR